CLRVWTSQFGRVAMRQFRHPGIVAAGQHQLIERTRIIDLAHPFRGIDDGPWLPFDRCYLDHVHVVSTSQENKVKRGSFGIDSFATDLVVLNVETVLSPKPPVVTRSGLSLREGNPGEFECFAAAPENTAGDRHFQGTEKSKIQGAGIVVERILWLRDPVVEPFRDL